MQPYGSMACMGIHTLFGKPGVVFEKEFCEDDDLLMTGVVPR